MNIKISKIVTHQPSNLKIDQGVSHFVTVDIFTKEKRSDSVSINVVIDDKENIFLTKDIEALALKKAKVFLNKAITNIKSNDSL